jgi:hypothetical protein
MDSSLKNQTEGEGVGGIFHEVGTHLLTLKGYVDDINTELATIPSLYVSKTGIITDINALSTGTINNTRLQPHAHNSLTSRDATGCHTIGAITDLTTTISGLAGKSTIIATINASAEATKISVSQLAAITHNTWTSRDASDCHPQAAITGLSTVVSSVGTHTAALSDIKGTSWASFDALFDMYDDMLDAMATELHSHTGFTIPVGWHKR